MGAHIIYIYTILLNLLNVLSKIDKTQGFTCTILFFATSTIINSEIQEHNCVILFIII